VLKQDRLFAKVIRHANGKEDGTPDDGAEDTTMATAPVTAPASEEEEEEEEEAAAAELATVVEQVTKKRKTGLVADPVEDELTSIKVRAILVLPQRQYDRESYRDPCLL
jgi:hypothetical protein